MTLRSRHGNARNHGIGPMVEVLPPNELPTPVQAPQHAVTGPERDHRGRWLPGARTSQSRGARAKAARVKLAAQLGLEDLAQAPDFAPYVKAAEDFAKAQASYLAERVGGGSIGPDVGSMVTTAAWQLAASRYLFARGVREAGDADLFNKASTLGNASRQNLLGAHELAAKAAQAQAQHRGPQPLAIPSSPAKAPQPPPKPRPVLDAPTEPGDGGTDPGGAPGGGKGGA
jgi:hypothetical protein